MDRVCDDQQEEPLITNSQEELDVQDDENEVQEEENEILVPNICVKDSGYAWIILAAIVVCNILTTGYSKGFGLLYSAIFDAYPDTSATMAGVMMGLLTGCRTLFAPVAGMMANKIGIRRTMYLGVILFSSGLSVSIFCTKVCELAFTLGAMVGIGHCLIETCQIVVISNYFETKLPFANGIRAAGSPLGGILYPMMLGILLKYVGLKNTFLLLSAVVTHLFISTTLVRPIHVQLKIKTLNYIKKVFKDLESGCQPTPQCENQVVENTSENYMINQISLNAKKKNLYQEIVSKNAMRSSQMVKKPLNVSFLKNPTYILFLLMAAGSPMAFPLGLYYLSIYAKTVVGLSIYEVTAVLSFQAVFDSVLRLVLGWLNNKNLYKKSNGFIFCLWLNGVGTMIIPLANKFWSMMCVVILVSFGPAAFHTFTNVILTEEFGKENISTTWGFLRMTQGIFSFIHPAIIGFLVDATGEYTIPFIIMGVASFYSGFILLLQYPVIKCSQSRIVIF